jgi:hypothetical protein
MKPRRQCHGKQTAMPCTCHRKRLAYATATKIGDIEMAENLAPKDLNAPADNLLPFPAILAAPATGEKLYTADELKQTFTPGAATNRTVRDLVAKVREAYYWLDEVEFKRGDNFTQFCFEQIKAMKDSGLTQKQWILEVQKQKPTEKSSQNLLQKPLDGELMDDLQLPSSAIVPIAGIDRLTQTRQEFQTNTENLGEKLANIQQRLAEHQQQKSANDESFDLGLKSRRAALLAKVAEAAIEDKLTAEQLYDAIVTGQLDLTPKSPVGNG